MIGQMKDQVRVLKKTRISNGRGGWSTETIPLGSFWACVLPLSAKEINEFRQIHEAIDTKIFFRFDDRLDTDCLIDYDGVTYEIQQVISPIFRPDYIQVLATRGKRS